MLPLEHVAEQLWAPALATGRVRVVVNPRPDPEWRAVEAYWAVPDAAHARLLVPRLPRRARAASLSNFHGLRRPVRAQLRRTAGRAARLGIPLSRDTVVVQVRAGHEQAADSLPLALLRQELGVRCHASIGVRAGANRKATLSLVDPVGRPVGYAKFGWNDIADSFVRTETATLRALAGGDDLVRMPRVLAELDHHGHPVVVVQPLPLDAVGGPRGVPAPSAREMFALAPRCRTARPWETGHLAGVRDRLTTLLGSPLAGAVAKAAQPLLEGVLEYEAPMPVSTHWHGDLSPWNRARDGEGRLWVWDWETTEPDALTGLDALHWCVSVRRSARCPVGAIGLTGPLDDAAAYLTAAGLARSHWPVLAAAYALTVVERAGTLADRSGGWARVWMGPEDLTALVDEGMALLRR